jgi:predicted enzyme related to lactoylglutathione lyase
MSNDTNPLARHGGLSYLKIPAIDAARSAAFYQHVTGWKIDQRSASDYRFSDGHGQLIGRWVTDRAAARDASLLPYFYVDDIAVAIARATEHGGEILKPPRLEGDTHVAEVRDPGGNLIGLWQFARGG